MWPYSLFADQHEMKIFASLTRLEISSRGLCHRPEAEARILRVGELREEASFEQRMRGGMRNGGGRRAAGATVCDSHRCSSIDTPK